MECQSEHSFGSWFIEIQLTIQGTPGDLLAHNLPQLWERLKAENQQAAYGPNQPSAPHGYRRLYIYPRHPHPPNAPSQYGKDTKAGEVPSEPCTHHPAEQC